MRSTDEFYVTITYINASSHPTPSNWDSDEYINLTYPRTDSDLLLNGFDLDYNKFPR